jgi:hypothetical protein
MNRRLAFLRRRPAPLIAAANDRLAFLEHEFAFERTDEAAIHAGDRHPDIDSEADTLLMWHRGDEIFKLTRTVVPFRGEAISLDWFPAVMPKARYSAMGFPEASTFKSYDRELKRMVDSLLPDLKTSYGLWRASHVA